MKNLVIIGASGHGEVCAEIAEQMNVYESIAFLDDDENKKKCLHYDVIGKISDITNYSDSDFFVAIGNNKVRNRISSKITNLVTLIHPNTVISKSSVIEKGCVLMANVVINANCHIGKGCIINTASTIDHDCILNDYVHVSPGANIAGNCCIGHRTWLGIGASLSNNITIGNDIVIGAGSVVIDDILIDGVYAGTPAKRIR